MEIEYKAVYKSDAERVSELLRNAGYQVEQNILGLDISDGKYTIGAILEPDPDHENGTQFFVSSNNEYDDGYLVLFQEGYPEDEQYEICHAVKWAFNVEKEGVNRRRNNECKNC